MSLVQVFNLNSPQTVYKELDSPLKFQTRCITCFPDATGYLESSIILCSPKEHLNRSCKIIFAVSASCCALSARFRGMCQCRKPERPWAPAGGLY